MEPFGRRQAERWELETTRQTCRLKGLRPVTEERHPGLAARLTEARLAVDERDRHSARTRVELA